MKYLLDTCVISDFFKKVPSVVERFQALPPDEIYISSITVMEIEYGLRLNLQRATKIQPLFKDLCNMIHVAFYTSQCAEASASIRAHLKNQGLPIGPYDLLLGGTAIAHRMILVTSNCKEFIRISNITIEDWREKH